MHLELADNLGTKVSIKDPKRFHCHILQFHYQGSSIHDESGHYFMVDDTLREKLEDLIQALKKE